MKNYSQNDEQEIILSFFAGRRGRFLDIGAYDGKSLSNTRAIAELGWSGIMVEPSPWNLTALIESVAEFNNLVEVWGCAVSNTGLPAVLHMSSVPDRQYACSISDNEALVNEHTIIKRNVRFVVPTVRMQDLLQHGPFEFISIDAEYTDFLILQDSPRGLGGCELLCVESSGPEPRSVVVQYLQDKLGFTVFHETKENLIAKRSPA